MIHSANYLKRFYWPQNKSLHNVTGFQQMWTTLREQNDINEKEQIKPGVHKLF
jgi:hypothetical protein